MIRASARIRKVRSHVGRILPTRCHASAHAATVAPWPGYKPINLEDLWLQRSQSGCEQFLQDSSVLTLQYFQRGERDEIHVRGLVCFTKKCEGPPGHAHGGSSAAVLDEAMGTATWASGKKTMTRDIAVRYLRPIPLDSTFLVEAWISSTDGDTVTAKAHIKDAQSGKCLVSSSGNFIDVSSRAQGELW
jgi:acyl-coenzyme A thioesterase PaaI-like protein